MSVFTENKLYFNRKLGTERCIFADRISAGKQLARDIKNKIIPKGTLIVKEIPCPFVKGRIFPNISRFVLSNFRTMIDVIHVKPVYYLRSDGQWRDMMEAFSYAGNRNLTLKYEYLANAFIDFGYLNWLIKRCALLRGHVVYSGEGIPRYPVMLNTVTTAYPDPDPETATVDGKVSRESGGIQTWTAIRTGAGDTSRDNQGVENITLIVASDNTDRYTYFMRFIALFNTGSIPDTDTISSAIYSLMPTTYIKNEFGGSNSVSLVQSTPASNTGLAAADYANVGTTKQATDVAISTFVGGTYSEWTLNATGLASIDKAGITKFGMRATRDADNSEPTWASLERIGMNGQSADTADTTSDPKLAVTHTSAFTSGGWYMPLMGIG